jgi:hypothetical protein
MNSQHIVCRLLSSCGTPATVLPPTTLYNEGWMLRLVLDWASRHPSSIPELAFDEGSRWYSEALLPSRFKPRRRRDTSAEGFTHADGVIGHFRVRSGRGDIELSPGARQLTIVEAKMASGLSVGTKHAPAFNQAARNVACIAHMLSQGSVPEREPVSASFVLLAPQARISEGAFRAAMDKDAIVAAVRRRADDFDQAASDWCSSCFEPIAGRCSICALSWEDVLLGVREADPKSADDFAQFYAQCLKYNPIRPAA